MLVTFVAGWKLFTIFVSASQTHTEAQGQTKFNCQIGVNSWHIVGLFFMVDMVGTEPMVNIMNTDRCRRTSNMNNTARDP